MNTMKVSTRMLMLIGLLSSLLMAVGALGLFGLDRSNSALQTAFEGSAVPAAQLGEIRGLLLRNRLAVAMALVTPTAEVIEDSAKRVETNIARVTQLWDETRRRFGRGGPYLLGHFSIADAFYAPVAFRFRTYDVHPAGAAAEYMAALLAHPFVREWEADALAEREVIEADEPRVIYRDKIARA